MGTPAAEVEVLPARHQASVAELEDHAERTIESERRLIGDGLTFADVTILPRFSNILAGPIPEDPQSAFERFLVRTYQESAERPREISTETQLTRRIRLKIPIISAAMDTVTESGMAIVMAREGGVGVIHKNFPTIEQQAAEVRKVKRAEMARIPDPLELRPKTLVGEAVEQMEAERISSVMVTDVDHRLVGIVTHRDLKLAPNGSSRLADVMTTELVTGGEGMTQDEAKQELLQHRLEKLPLVTKEGKLCGLYTLRDIEQERNFPHSAKDAAGRLRVGAAVGVAPDMFDRMEALAAEDVDFFVFDSSLAHQWLYLASIREAKKLHPDIDIIGGNVVTAAGVEALIAAGADAAKIGMGGGAICTTQVVTGVGRKQLSAVLDCAEAAKGRIPIISDGAIRFSGDIVKAIGGGADVVMIGSGLAGTDESPGEVYQNKDGRDVKGYRGMGSIGAMKAGSRERYHQSGGALVPEGIEGEVDYRGPVRQVLAQMTGGLKKGMFDTGCATIAELKQDIAFEKVSKAGADEGHANVTMTRAAPNYSGR